VKKILCGKGNTCSVWKFQLPAPLNFLTHDTAEGYMEDLGHIMRYNYLKAWHDGEVKSQSQIGYNLLDFNTFLQNSRFWEFKGRLVK